MKFLSYRHNHLYFEEVALHRLANEFGTPLYVYSEAALVDNFARIESAFTKMPHSICYALKANSNPTIIRKLRDLGAGADVVSVGELNLALKADIDPQKIVFAGVGKRDDEILAALSKGIKGFNVESEMELQVINQLAGDAGKSAPISLRINPDIDIHGHPYISTGRHHDKFGIALETVRKIIGNFSTYSNCELVGLHAHLGSQVADIAPYAELGQVMRKLIQEVQAAGHRLRYIDVGGGLGVDYSQPINVATDALGRDDFAFDPSAIAEAISESIGSFGIEIVFEPGRALIANTGLLLTRVLYLKETTGKKFVIVDSGMTEMIRPSLYSAFHAIVPTNLRGGTRITADVVGPICESGDFLARDRELPEVQRGDVLAVLSAGAYGFTLSSNYNARPRPAEVLVSNEDVQVIRKRQSLETLWQE